MYHTHALLYIHTPAVHAFVSSFPLQCTSAAPQTMWTACEHAKEYNTSFEQEEGAHNIIQAWQMHSMQFMQTQCWSSEIN